MHIRLLVYRSRLYSTRKHINILIMSSVTIDIRFRQTNEIKEIQLLTLHAVGVAGSSKSDSWLLDTVSGSTESVNSPAPGSPEHAKQTGLTEGVELYQQPRVRQCADWLPPWTLISIHTSDAGKWWNDACVTLKADRALFKPIGLAPEIAKASHSVFDS